MRRTKNEFRFHAFWWFLTNQPFYKKKQLQIDTKSILILIVEKICKNEIDCLRLVNNLEVFFVIVTDIYYKILDFFDDFLN